MPVAAPGPSRRHSKLEPVSLEENANVAEFVVIVPVGPESIVVFGAAVSTVKVREAGVGSTLPAVSRARTSNVCAPCARFVYACGDVHGANAALSRRHSNVEPGLVEVNANDGDALLVAPVGPLVIAVSGNEVSTVNVREAGVASTLPAASVARTRNVYVPSTSGPSVRGEVQLTYVPVAEPGPSRRHSKLEPVSLEENANCGEAELIVPVGPESIVVSGATVSTVKVRVAGVASTLPAASRARTSKVCAPCARLV